MRCKLRQFNKGEVQAFYHFLRVSVVNDAVIVDEAIGHIIDDEVESKNAYDINEFCIKYAVVFPEKFLQPEEVNVLKNDAYIQGLTLMEYMKIIAVMARDKYFEENNINIEEIDPSTKQ